MYYKIITPRSFFTHVYDTRVNIFNIPYGKVFTATKHTAYKPDDPKCLVNESCFHFADGAFDTMLWHTALCHHVLHCQIYQIEPLSDVIKERCKDSKGIYQCGAHKIKFLGKQNIDKMYEQAIQEYYQDPDRYTNFKISINWWKKHQPTVFLLYKTYQ